MRVKLFELALIALMAAGAVRAEEFSSPDQQVKINLDCDSDGFNCKASYKAANKTGKLEVVGNNIGVKFFGNTAAVTSSCGSACSGTDLVDRTGPIGTYSDLLSFEESSKCVAYMEDANVIRFDAAGKKVMDVNVNSFKPRPMKTASFSMIAEGAMFEKGSFSVSYPDQYQKSQKVVIKGVCTG